MNIWSLSIQLPIFDTFEALNMEMRWKFIKFISLEKLEVRNLEIYQYYQKTLLRNALHI